MSISDTEKFCLAVLNSYLGRRPLGPDYLEAWASSFQNLIVIPHELFKDHVIPLWKSCRKGIAVRAANYESVSPNWKALKPRLNPRATHALITCRLRDDVSLAILLDGTAKVMEWISVVDSLLLEPEQLAVDTHSKQFIQEVAQWLGFFILSKRCIPRNALAEEFVRRVDPRHCTQVSMLWLKLRLLDGDSVNNARNKLTRGGDPLREFMDKFLDV